MKTISGRWVWRGILLVLLFSWIPLNLWFRRHDDALFNAVSKGDLVAAQRAVKAGGNVNLAIRRGNTLLHVAAFHHDNADVARFLVERGVSADARNDEHLTALQIAERDRHERIADFLRSNERLKVGKPETLQRGGSPSASTARQATEALMAGIRPVMTLGQIGKTVPHISMTDSGV